MDEPDRPTSETSGATGDDRGRWTTRRRVLTVAGGVAAAGALGAGAWAAWPHVGPAAPAEPPLTGPVERDSGVLSAFPKPGTPTARPQTQISLRGLPADALGEVVVDGERSGRHEGRLLAHSDGGGASFVPSAEFEEGETVTVTTEHDVRGAGGRRYSFTIAELADRPDLEAPPVDPEAEGFHRFASAPDLRPPLVDVHTSLPRAVDGLVALGLKNGYGQKGPLLLDAAGQPVWFHPLTGVDARDVRLQQLGGQPVLTWWEGVQATGYGYGELVAVDTGYREVARFGMGNGYDADAHEFILTDAGTALLVAYEPVRMDLSHRGGARRASVIDCVVQEVDVDTGAVLFEWHSVGEVSLDESYLPVEDERYDYVHVNAVDVDVDGNLLVSARHTSAVYSLDRVTGGVRWRLGGRASDFEVAPEAVFIRQHDVRRASDGTLTMFDNGSVEGELLRESSRVLSLDVDEVARTVTVAREITHPDGLFAESQGSAQELPGGGFFVGWGNLLRYSAFDPDGALLLDATFPSATRVSSYRAFSVTWDGQPTTDPSAVRSKDGLEVLASWNGATRVATWQVVDAAGGTVLGSAPRSGFETAVPVPAAGAPAGLRVEALDADGHVLGAVPVG
ncbi:arylsulfotransferase family protein [Kineococcus arenarius]|uniref:arylsulfotransferase family protein n=1 Tax=unclassified Kineococcus TaxID=2621656 RepID=UPI003D7C80E2